MSLIVTGTIGIDTVETPDANVERVLGGSCSYFAAAAAKHAPVRVVAAVGGDWPAEHATQLEAIKGIDLAGLERRPNETTFAWGGRYFDNMNERETLFTELGVLEGAPPPVPAAFADSKMVFLANSHPAVQMQLLSQVPDRTFAVADSMDLWINIANDELHALMKSIDGIVINDAEAELLTGRRNAVTAARAVLELGPSFVIVKKGEHGAILVHQDGVAAIPAFPADAAHVIDPTGAGDSFAGGMMGYLAATGRTDFEAIQTGLAWGTVTASFTIESFSLDRLAAATDADVQARMTEFKQIARVGE